MFLGIGKALVLSHVLGFSEDMLTVAAGVGEKIFRIPRFEDEKDQFMDFLRNLRSEYDDDHDVLLDFYGKFCKNQLSSSVYGEDMRFISNLSLKRIGKVRTSLGSQLRQLLPDSSNFRPSNYPNSVKLLSLCAFYPDVALKLSKRNQYLLPGAISAELQKESMQYVESLENVLSQCHGQEQTINNSSKSLVFEELFDAGHSMIVKTCNIDPLFTILFADNILIMHKTIFVDNWIRITSEDSESLKMILEIRQLWKSLTRRLLSSNNSKTIEILRKLLNHLSEIWNPQRHVEIK